jgi:hypothetical protein
MVILTQSCHTMGIMYQSTSLLARTLLYLMYVPCTYALPTSVQLLFSFSLL